MSRDRGIFSSGMVREKDSSLPSRRALDSVSLSSIPIPNISQDNSPLPQYPASTNFVPYVPQYSATDLLYATCGFLQVKQLDNLEDHEDQEADREVINEPIEVLEPRGEALDTLLESLSTTPYREETSAMFAAACQTLSSSPLEPYTPPQVIAHAVSERFARNPVHNFEPDKRPPSSSFAYKKVANKIRPVATTLPENFRIIRHDHPDPLAGMHPMPVRPPDFVPTGRFTAQRRDQMAIGKDLLWPEEIKLAEWIVAVQNEAFTWTDEERGSFDPKYFAPIEIPVISHIPWLDQQGPIPRGILPQVTKVIEDKWRSGAYEPSSSSYNSRWFCVLKKDRKSLRLVHALEPLNSVTIKNAAMPPYTEMLAEDFSGRSIYTTLDLYVAFDQRQLQERSRDLTTFSTPLGAFRLTVLPMGWTNSPAILQGDVSHILRPEIPHCTLPFIDDILIKGPKSRYELPDGSFETIPGNPGIRRFVWEHLEAVYRIMQRMKVYGGTFSGTKSFIGVPQTTLLGHVCTYEGRIVDPTRAQAIANWPVPTNATEVRAFLGTCGVHRIFIKVYTIVARPLIKLTRKDEPFVMKSHQLEAIAKLKEAIATSAALRPIDYESDQPVILAVDSCANGAGYILSQLGDDKKRYPSRFGSITFNERESRYSQAKLELYGLFRSLKATQVYTIGVKKLIVEMDAKFIKGMINNPTLHPNDAVNRWIAAILLFDFKLVHIPAEKHTGADGLSRRPRADGDPEPEDPDELEEWIDTNSGFYLALHSPPSVFDPIPPLVLEVAPSTVYLAEAEQDHETTSPHQSSPATRRESLDPLGVSIPRSDKALLFDAKILTIRRFLETLERPPELTDRDYERFLRRASSYFELDGKLFRKNKKGPPRLIPEVNRRSAIIQYAHDHLGHKGVFATTHTGDKGSFTCWAHAKHIVGTDNK